MLMRNEAHRKSRKYPLPTQKAINRCVKLNWFFHDKHVTHIRNHHQLYSGNLLLQQFPNRVNIRRILQSALKHRQ